jgi:ribosomal protein L37E
MESISATVGKRKCEDDPDYLCRRCGDDTPHDMAGNCKLCQKQYKSALDREGDGQVWDVLV